MLQVKLKFQLFLIMLAPCFSFYKTYSCKYQSISTSKTSLQLFFLKYQWTNLTPTIYYFAVVIIVIFLRYCLFPLLLLVSPFGHLVVDRSLDKSV